MQIIEVTWGMAFKVWWSILWRSLLVGLLAGFAFGFIFGIVAVALELGSTVRALAVLCSFLFGIVVAIWAVKKVLYKRYSNFSIVCIANEPVQSQQVQNP